MNNSVNTKTANKVRSNNPNTKAPSKAKAKKVYKPSKVQAAKSKANQGLKDYNSSLSAMERYIRNEGKKDVENLLKACADQYGYSIAFNKVNKKFILSNMSEARATVQTFKNGSTNENQFKNGKRVVFSFYLDVLNTISRVCKEQAKKQAKK